MFPQNSRIDIRYITFIFFVFLFSICLVNVTGGAVNSEKFNKLDGYRIKDIIETINCSTKLQCCSQCIKKTGCVSVNFRQNSPHLNCDVNWNSPLYANVSMEKIANSTVFYIDNVADSWKLVFRLTTGRTTNPFHAWKNGLGTDNGDDCMMLYPPSCTSYYRHNLLDNWSNSSIKQVKLALYENHVLVASITFNGTGSDMESWFSKDRVIQTSWTDLVISTQTFFSLKGDQTWGRHFFIHGPYMSCSTDYGWMLINSGQQPFCPFDQQAPYPVITYARNKVKSTYGSQETASNLCLYRNLILSSSVPISILYSWMSGYGEADVLAIYIKEN